MPQGSDPRRRPDRQSSEPDGQPEWWMTLWQERLPHESDEPTSRASGLLGWLAQRAAMVVLPLLVVAAVVLGGFHLDLEALIVGGVAAAIVVIVAAWPALERSRPSRR